MGIKETFNFDDSTYEEKLKGMSTDQIQSREVVKIRQYISGSIGVGCILGAAVSTMGASLVVLPYVLRMVNIARRKLNIIRRVLFRRGIPPYELTKRDFVIPLAIRATSLGLGAAVGLFIDITTVMPLDKVSPSGYDAVSSAVNNPDATLKGFTDGFTEQGNQAAIEETARHAVAHQQISNDLPAHDVAQSGFQSTPDPILDIESDPAYLTGMQQGATVASLMESKAVTAALSQLPLVVQMPWERGDNQDETAQFHISCDKCEKAFEASRTQHWRELLCHTLKIRILTFE